MTKYLLERARAGALLLTPLSKDELKVWLAGQPRPCVEWVKNTGFTAAPGTVCPLPSEGGALTQVLAGIDPKDTIWSYAALPSTLAAMAKRNSRAACFVLDAAFDTAGATRAALGWALGTYVFDRYRKAEQDFAALVWPKGADRAAVTRTCEAIFLVRDLINTPACDLGPAELAEAALEVFRHYKGSASAISGDALLSRNYPAVHAVGRASERAPCLIDAHWGRAGPRVTLVGKGVCFDSGGLDLKSAAGMRLMKKDMGGAAHVLGLAHMIMAAKLPLRLRVLIPAVENSVSGDAFRPSDVIATRKGLSVEVGNTDAEGRLVLADALCEADSDNPDLIVDFATLTGAARVALGPALPAMFCNDDRIAAAMSAHGLAEDDPVWRLPLYAPYRAGLDSKVADLNNISGDAYGGAIVAALFLAEFVRPTTPWLHFDIMAWNTKSAPGRPEGGEAMALRAVYALIAELATRSKRAP